MSYNPNNPNGSATSANSAPVVIASDQAAVSVSSTTLATNAIITGGTQTSRLTDGTNTAAVKAASTAAAATDPSVVVNISPNSPAHPVTVSGSAAVTGTFWQATQPVSLATNTPVLAAGAAIVGKVGIDQTTVGTTNAVSVAQIGANTVLTGNGVTGTGSLRVTLASDTSQNTNSFKVVTPATATSSGLLLAKINSAASTNATNVKASAGTIYGWALTNTTAVTQVVHIYNLAVAPTVGTSVPIFNIILPANGGMVMPKTDPNIPFATGLSYAITTGLIDLDATATTINSVIGTIFYI